VIVFEFQGHAGNSAFVTAVSFLETKRYHNGPNQASQKAGGHSHVFKSQKLLMLLLVSKLLRLKLHRNPLHIQAIT
jgi:hypothetical protein